jgi:aryl-alcohol dehydrogenase-like predicted oxidoreductase
MVLEAAASPAIPRVTLDGMAGEISSLIVGCDNQDTLEGGSVIWDAWWEAGGNAFDTAFVYGRGLHEQVLGQWMRARGVAEEARVIVKGAHTPHCVPDAIGEQLAISLDRLQLNHAPVYIMHRDNPDVPVGEFVDALNALHDKGLIGAFGGSNWSVQRFAEAKTYAEAKGLRPLSILNNNLSLAVMERPVWAGCITSNQPEALAFLRETGATHVSWSSQARGYFLRRGERTELPEDTAPDTCFDSSDNAERLRRAEQLAADKGVHAHNIATAWVLGQSFPSLALIGPRTVGEITSTLPALSLELSAKELAWLNLE